MYRKDSLAGLLQNLDLGGTVAEQDGLLETARVETSTFSDLLADRVDLIPGTKGSGKSALYRIFVDFLPAYLLEHKKVVVAHGVQRPGDPVFLAFKDQFEKLDEKEFVDFWLIYLTSLAHEQFIKGSRYATYLVGCDKEIVAFRDACAGAHIPEFSSQKSLKETLEWTLEVLRTWAPKIKYVPSGNVGEIDIDLFGNPVGVKKQEVDTGTVLPLYTYKVADALKVLLTRCDLSVWLMIDKLDEIFPRRSDLEARALRGLLSAMKFFDSESIRVKIFLRDDMLEEIVSDGFTALTHITARQADTLRWSEQQILTMVVKRLFAKRELLEFFEIEKERLESSYDYREHAFYKVFPRTVHSGKKQSTTLRWIYSHTQDGKGVVTPRDVIHLISRAKQKQQDEFMSDSAGGADYLIGPSAIKYGFAELSKQKYITYLKAEFPHLHPFIEKFMGGKTQYSEDAIRKMFGGQTKKIVEDLISIGLVTKGVNKKSGIYSIPPLYQKGLGLTRGLHEV